MLPDKNEVREAIKELKNFEGVWTPEIVKGTAILMSLAQAYEQGVIGEIEKYRTALDKIMEYENQCSDSCVSEITDIAKQALSKKEGR